MKLNKRSVVIILIFMNSVLLLKIYNDQILYNHSVYSELPKIFSRSSVLLILPVALLFMSRKLVLPSHIFFFLQALLLLYPQLLFWGLSGSALPLMPLYICFLMLLFLILQLLLKSVPNFFAIRHFGFTDRALSAFFIFLLFWFAIQFRSSLGFAINDSYDRRLAAFDVMQENTFMLYAYTIACYGLASYFGFLGGFRLHFVFLTSAIFMGVLAFAISGEKMPALLVIVSVGVGVFLRRRASLSPVFVQCVLSVGLVLAITEYSFFSNSMLTDILARRMFFSQPLINEVAVEFTSRPGWNLLTGSDFGSSYSRIVGEEFFGRAGQNSNSSPFILSFFGGGLLQLIIELTVLFSVFWLLDSRFKKTGDKSTLWAGVFIGMLSLEQPFTTMIFTSGVVIILLAIIFGKSKNAKN
jgi:hypothetical protein